MQDLARVFFMDESRCRLDSSNGHSRVYSRVGKRFYDSCVIQRRSFVGLTLQQDNTRPHVARLVTDVSIMQSSHPTISSAIVESYSFIVMLFTTNMFVVFFETTAKTDR